MKPWTATAQRKRFRALAALIRARLRPLLDDQAHSEKLLWWDQDRVEIWASNAFFAGNDRDIAFANTILRHVRDVLHRDWEPAPDPFGASSTAAILAGHGDKLEPDVRRYFTEHLERIAPLGMTRDYQFHGYNDNMPVMWTWALTFAGEYFGRKDLREMARANLHQLQDLLRRRGTVSEYGQLYATHRLTGIAHIAEHSRDARIRKMARDIEARLWAELAGHWHPGLGYVCGPAMRGGYPIGSETSILFTLVFGSRIEKPWMRLESLFDASDTVKSLGKDPNEYIFAYPFGYAAEFGSATYHVPGRVAQLFLRKPVNFRFQCTAECGYVNEGIFCKQIPVYGTGGILITTKLTDEVVVIKDHPEHGAQPHGLTTFHGKNYSLGSSTTNMFTTSHALRCTWRRREKVRGPIDLGELFIRYNINRKVPGGRLTNIYWKDPEYRVEKENYCTLYYDQGRHFCLQHDNAVLCLSTPEYREWWQVRELRLDVFLHQPVARETRIWFGRKRVTRLPFVASHEARIDFDEGATFLSLHPLIGRHLKRKCAVRIAEVNEYLVISLFNYEGPRRAFTPHEIAKLGNGFVIEARDDGEYPSFRAFQKEMSAARILDQLYGGRRRVHYARPDLRLSTHYCPYTKTTMYDSVNGLNQAMPQFACSDGSHTGLPFFDARPAVGFEDWDWIQSQIGRERESYNPPE